MKRIPARAVMGTLSLVAVLATAAAALQWWTGAVAGLALMHLGTVLVVLGPWSKSPLVKPGPSRQITDLERRVDLLGARTVASLERIRVELLDARAATGWQDADER